MITQLQRIKAARRIVVGLLFVFMAMVAIAQDTPSGSGWNGTPAGSIENKDGGNGESAAAAIHIKDAAELAYFAQLVNKGETKVHITNGNDLDITAGFEGSHIKLTDDIDLNKQDWTPIGNDKFFRGHFDGDGHVVTGLKININDQASKIVFAGLFGSTSGGEIRNLGVRLAEEGIKVECTNEVWVGGIVGYTFNTTIRNCYVDAEKGGKIRVNTHSGALLGGIAGELEGTITHCYSTVDIKAESVAGNVNYDQQETNSSIGGIVGSNNGTISHCYATGSVIGVGKVESGKAANLYIGGICGYNSNFGSLIQNNLALNKELSGETNKGQCYVNRIVGQSGTALSNNYANPKMPVTPVSGNLTNNEAGTDTWLETFKDDLRNVSGGDGWSDGKGWEWPTEPSSTLLPKLKVVVTDKDGMITDYEKWPGIPAQPNIDAADYLDGRKTLHIVQPKEGTLTVSYDTPNAPAFKDGDLVVVGSTLKLLYTPPTTADYSLDKYLYGTSADQINQSINGDTYVMPNQDIWISASVNEPSKPDTEPDPVYPPPTPIYYTVTLPQVEGATTDPGAGDHEVESWNTFRFYLMLDSAYSDSQPIVTTSRGETLTPRTSDGAYLVKYVRTDVEVRIDSIRPNLPPVANEAIAAPTAKVWTANAHLHMQSPTAADAYIYAANGRRQALCRLTPGKTESLRLPAIYLIRIGKDSFKIVL